MQSVSSLFNQRARGDMRPISVGFSAAFDKVFDAGIDFFTIGLSQIGGTDYIPGSGNVSVEWDKYTYVDYSDRVISMEWTQQEESPSSVALAMADIELDNHDDFFTPGGGSAIEDYILPSRPMRLKAGFGDELIPVLVGLSETMPELDQKNKTVRFHILDFLSFIFEKSLNESLILQNVRTDEVLDSLFMLAGLTSTQYVLDYGFNIIPFVYFEKDMKLGDAVRELMEAEQGRVYMDENGIIRFKNRQNYSSTPVYFFDKSNTNDSSLAKQDAIINSVEVKVEVREIQPIQMYWSLSQSKLVPAGETVDIWADFNDPVTSVQLPTYNAFVNNSNYLASDAEDGDGTLMPEIVLDSATLFANSYKMTFENTGSQDGYVYLIELWATPAKVTRTLDVKEQDDTSVDKYGEQILTIENNYLQTEPEAQSKALVLIDDYKDLNSAVEIDVKGNMALQIGDPITLDEDGASGTYVIKKIVNKIMPTKYTQIITARKHTFRSYFQIGVSSIGGTDSISP